MDEKDRSKSAITNGTVTPTATIIGTAEVFRIMRMLSKVGNVEGRNRLNTTNAVTNVINTPHCPTSPNCRRLVTTPFFAARLSVRRDGLCTGP